MRRLARLLWRVMPRWLREPMAIEAPVVLKLQTYAGWESGTTMQGWLRREVEYCAGPTSWDDDQEPTAWGFGRYAQQEDFDGEFPTHEQAFQALTEHLRARPDVVLAEGP